MNGRLKMLWLAALFFAFGFFACDQTEQTSENDAVDSETDDSPDNETGGDTDGDADSDSDGDAIQT